jgi:transcriptional regulator with XRE-family HTH domain
MSSKKNSLKIDKEILMAIGSRIIDIRKKLRINQKEFAASLDMSPSYLSTIENGNGNPCVGFFFRLSMTYNVNLNYLIHGTGNMFIKQEIKKPFEKKDFADGIETVEDMLWLMENSTLFKATVIGFSNKFFYENERTIKRSLKKRR